MEPLGIVGLVIMGIGFALVYAARYIVKKYDLASRQKCEHEAEMEAEEVENYKMNKAVVNIKIIGFVLALPGLVLLFLFT